MNGGIGNGETSWETSVAMCDNDEQLILRTANQRKSLYDGNGDVGNDPGNLVQRKPKPHSQCVTQIHGEKDRSMLSPDS